MAAIAPPKPKEGEKAPEQTAEVAATGGHPISKTKFFGCLYWKQLNGAPDAEYAIKQFSSDRVM